MNRKPPKPTPPMPRDYRKELWISVAAHVSGAIGCKEFDTAANWADQAVDSFDNRFGEQE